MNTRLVRISPIKMSLLLGSFAFALSLSGLFFLFTTPMTDSTTVTLGGFFTWTFHGSIDVTRVLLFSIFSTINGAISGLLIGIIFNIWARLTGGLNLLFSESVTNTADQNAAANP